MGTLCPLIKENCVKNICVMWKDNRCTLVTFLEVEIIDPYNLNIEKGDIKQKSVSKEPDPLPLEIDAVSHKQLAQEIVSLAKQNFSLENDELFSLPYEVTEYFWTTKGIIDQRGLPESTKLKIKQAEKLADLLLEKEKSQLDASRNLATRNEVNLEIQSGPNSSRILHSEKTHVPQEIIDASPEALADEFIQFAKNETMFSYEESTWIGSTFRYFWSTKGVIGENWNLPPDIQMKFSRIKDIAFKKLSAEREAIRQNEIEKEKTNLPNLITKCTEWANEHGLKKLTLADVDAFLLGRNLRLHSENRRSLWALANVEVKSSKK